MPPVGRPGARAGGVQLGEAGAADPGGLHVRGGVHPGGAAAPRVRDRRAVGPVPAHMR